MVDKSGHRLKDFVQENMKMMKDMTDTRPPTITRFGDVAPPVVSLFAPRYQSSAEPAPTESSNAELTSLSLAAVPLPRAPMPELSDELSSMRRAKIENVMKEVFTDPDRLEELQNQLTEFVLTAPAREAVKTTQSRQRVMSYYFAMMERMAPRIRSYERFYIAVALKYIPLLLPFMVEAVRPRPGHTVLKSRTVVGWLGIVVHLLLQYTQDPTNNRRCGLEALSQHSLYDTLQKVVFRLVREKGLDRYYDHRIYYGQMEVRLMIEAALAHATPTNCMVKVNSLLKILLPFYLTSRPSTLGLACKEYTSLHAYLALGHLKIYHLADGAFQIDVLLLTFKQYFKEHGSSQDWTLYQTQRTHNVPFDVVDYLVSYLFMAGAFEKKFETLDELLNDKDAELHIDPSRRDEPLFPAMTAGGRAFEEPLRPATAHSLSATCHTLAVDAGLVAVGIQSLRRGSADYYAMVKGKQYAKTALNHVKEDTFDGHYDKGTRNMNPVADRLGEDVPEGSRHPKALDSNPRRSVAVRAWADLLLVDPSINSSSSEEQINEAKKTLKATEKTDVKAVIDENPDHQKLKEKCDEAWQTFRACLSPGINAFYLKDIPININRLVEMAAGVSDRPKEAVKRKLVFGLASDKTLADLKNAEAALKEANTEMNKSTQRLARTTRRVNRRTKKADYSAGHLPRGLSSEQMHDSVTLAQKRSTFLQSRMAEASSSSASSSSIASSSIASSSIASSSITSSSIASSSITSSPLSSASSCIPALVSASSSAPAPSSSASLSVSASLLATSLTPPAPSDIPKVSLDDAEADTDILDIGEYENPGYLDALLPIDAGIDLANIQMQVDSMPGPLNIGDESMSAQAAEDAEDERHQPELTDIPIREMHTFFMHHLIEKHEIKKEFDKARREDGTYVCPSCPAYRHRPPTVSSGVAHHQRHLDMLHSEWMDLEVRCYIGEEGFACPYCDQEFDDMTATREHMTEDADCPGYHSVRIMAIRHQRMTDVYRKRKSSATFEKTANKGDGFDDRHKELIKRGKAKALGKDTLFHRHCTLVVNAVQKDDEAPANVVNYIVDFVQMMRKRLHQQKPIGYNDFPSHV